MVFAGYTDTDTNNRFVDAFWVVNIDLDGHLIREWWYGGNSIDQISCIIPTRDGSYALGGYTWSDMGGVISAPSRGGGGLLVR